MNKKVLIIGAGGLIGSALYKVFIQKNSRLSPKGSETVQKN